MHYIMYVSNLVRTSKLVMTKKSFTFIVKPREFYVYEIKIVPSHASE